MKTSSTLSKVWFHVESGGCVGSNIASVAQLMTIASMMTRSNHGHRIRRHAARRTRLRSWKR